MAQQDNGMLSLQGPVDAAAQSFSNVKTHSLNALGPQDASEARSSVAEETTAAGSSSTAGLADDVDSGTVDVVVCSTGLSESEGTDEEDDDDSEPGKAPLDRLQAAYTDCQLALSDLTSPLKAPVQSVLQVLQPLLADGGITVPRTGDTPHDSYTASLIAFWYQGLHELTRLPASGNEETRALLRSVHGKLTQQGITVQGGTEFSLGSSLFGWTAASGHASPHITAATVWLSHLGKNHTPDISGLLLVSRSARETLLSIAHGARLRVSASAGISASEWNTQWQRVQRDMLLRGSLPTHIELVASGAHPLHPLTRTLFALPSTQISGLRVVEGWRAAYDSTALDDLLAAPTVGPHLQVLETAVWPSKLPPALSKLQQLHVHMSLITTDKARCEALCRLAEPYMAQLQSFKGIADFWVLDGYMPGHHLFNASTAPHTLTHVTLPAALDDTLLTLLLTHTPALTELGVSMVDISDHSHMQWGVQGLTLTWFQLWREYFTYLPRCTKGVRCVIVEREGELYLPVQDAQGFSIPVRQRLADYTFSHFRMCLWLNVPEAQRLTALRNVLTQCTSLNVTGTVAITGCQWTDAVVQAALQGIPQLSHLQFAFYCMDALTDELLGAALQLGSCMPTLYATGIELQSSKHAYKVWPCKVFNVQKFDMNMLPLLPMAREAGSEPVVQCRVVSLDTREQAKSPLDIIHRLQCLRWVPGTEAQPKKLNLFGPVDTTMHASVLRAHVAILRAMRIPSGFVSIYSDFTTDLEVLEAYQGLPHWRGAVEFGADWEQPAGLYGRVPHLIPTSYGTWVLPVPSDCPMAKVVRAAVDRYRRALQLPKLQLRFTQAVVQAR